MTDLRRHIPPIALSWDDEATGQLWQVVEGTLVFADVSGFTTLTEKLSQRGRIGAEEIVETLNRVFGPMLHVAGTRGGELLKFGGDALLFLFRGEDHTEQACDAAVEMRTALRQAAAVPTSVGRLSLKMSVGIHSGEIHLFLVGAPTRELLILGPGATLTALAEKAAEAGEIAVSADTVARLTPNSVRTRRDRTPLLRRRYAHSTPSTESRLPSVGRERVRGLFPVALGDYLDSGVPDPEHRIACIAFVRFSGTDALLTDRGPEVLAQALHETVSLVEGALATESITLLATDLDSDGGKFFLGSGIPTTFEDNDGRMLRALRRIADSGAPLALQLGVNRGHVFAAEVGIPDRGAYTGMGDTTNTAARIMSKAPPGILFAHPTVLEHSRTRFAVQPAGPFPMKGKAVPLLVYEVGEELDTAEEATADARLPFLGRDEELATLRRAIDAALDGTGGVITIAGSNGMGKSRLAFEAVMETVDAQRVVVRAEPYGATSAYRVFRDPLRRLLGLERDTPEVMGQALLATLDRIAPDLLPMAPLLADVVQVDVPDTPEVDQLEPQYRPDRLADVVVRLADEAMPGRLIVIAEEAHWADGASARLLDRIAAASTGRPWAVIAIRRGDEGGFAPMGGTQVTLNPLPADVMERLVIAATEATPLRPHEIAAVVDRAEGNPLFVEEVTRVALDTASLDTMPESVQAAMSAQIDLLHPNARRVLRYCAVLGRSFRLEVLQRTLATDGLVADISTLSGLGSFLQADGTDRMRFRNSLVRDAAYEGLAFRFRSRLHRTAGETLEAISTDLDADASTLSLHFWRAGDAERTWKYSQLAGEIARRAYANVDAAQLYERALEVSRRVPGVGDVDRAASWAILGELRELAGVLDGSVDAYRRAAAVTADPVDRAEFLARGARVHERAGAYRAALRQITQARRLLDNSPGPRADMTSVRLDNLTAIVRLAQERAADARRWAIQAASQARVTGDTETLASALVHIDLAEIQLGTADVGANTREALELFVAMGDLGKESVALSNLGGYAFLAGRWEESVDWFTSSRQIDVKIGRLFAAAETDAARAEILIHQGRIDEAGEILPDAVRVLRASGVEFSSAYAEMQQARILLARGDVVAAGQLAAQVATSFMKLGSPVTAMEASLVRAEAATAAGRPAEALELVSAAEHATRGEGASLTARANLVRARAQFDLGLRDEAGLALEAGLAAAIQQKLPYEEALLLQARSRLRLMRGGDEESALAADDATRAEHLFDALGVKPDGPHATSVRPS